MALLPAAKPRIRVRNADPADVPDLVRIHFAAFDTGPISRLLHPGGASADARAKFGSAFFPSQPSQPLQTASPSTSGEAIVMVAELLPNTAALADVSADGSDAQTTEVIAYAKWMLFRAPRPESEWNVERLMTAKLLGEGTDVEIYDEFIGGLHRMRRRWMRGDPAFVLDILACAPTHHRLGAGTALVQWGVEFSDKEGLTSWLEASPMGYPLYRRFGYEDVEVQDIEITRRWNAVQLEGEDWGLNSAVALAGKLPEGLYRSVLMKRTPNAQTACHKSESPC